MRLYTIVLLFVLSVACSVIAYADTTKIVSVFQKKDAMLAVAMLSDGTKFEVPLVRVEGIAVLRTPAGVPYLLVSAATCTECDMNQSIYLVARKTEGSGHDLPRYRYPGVLEDLFTEELIEKSRMFYGRCLPETLDVVVFYGEYRGADSKWHKIEHVIRLTNEGPVLSKLTGTNRDMKGVISKVDSKECSELLGINSTTEP